MRFAGDQQEPVSSSQGSDERTVMGDHSTSPTDPRARFGTGSKFGENIEDEDRDFAARREPIGHYVTRVIAEDMWDNWFKVDDLATKGRDPDFNTIVQAALLKLNAKALFIRATQLERIFGYSIIALAFRGESDLKAAHKKSSTAKIVDAYPYRKTQVSRILFDNDQRSRRYGLPRVYQINRGSGESSEGGPTLDIHYTRVLHLAPRLLIESAWQGESVIDIVYDDLIILRNMRWSIGETMYSASTATEIPVDILRGAQAGALEGSVLNDKQRWKYISKNQEMYEPYLRHLIALMMKSGQIKSKVKNYEFIWGEGFELTAKEAAHADLLRENALKASLSYMTLEEVRDDSGKRGLKGPLDPKKRELILAQTQKGQKKETSTQKNPNKT